MAEKNSPPRDELADDEDELDGCDLDFSPDAIADDEILGVVLGDDAEKFNAYRKLFGNQPSAPTKKRRKG